MQRKIIHIDMDAFYASVEQRDNPDLRNKPVAVGSSHERGVISAASYEARKFGVRSAMSSVRAKRLCPDLIFVQGNMKKYKEVSSHLMRIFSSYTDLIEPLSIDEAFLDVTHNKKNLRSATEIAETIRNEIYQQLQLTASAGVSVNKFLAKIASDINKPNGMFVILPGQIDEFIDALAVEKFFGIGKVTAAKMHKLGIHTGKDLKQVRKEELMRWFGKQGSFFFEIARGIDERMVDPGRERKSVGAERTFEKDLQTKFSMIVELYKIEQEQFERIKKHEFWAHTLSLKVKFSDFSSISRSLTAEEPIKTFEHLHKLTKKMFSSIDFSYKSVRLFGLSCSNLHVDKSMNEPIQLTLEF